MNPNKAILNFYNNLSEEKKIRFGHGIENFRHVVILSEDGKFVQMVDFGKDNKQQAVVESFKRGSGIISRAFFEVPQYYCGVKDGTTNSSNHTRVALAHQAFIDRCNEFEGLDGVEPFIKFINNKSEVNKLAKYVTNIFKEGDIVSFTAFQIEGEDEYVHDYIEVCDHREQLLIDEYVVEDYYDVCTHCGKTDYPMITSSTGRMHNFSGAIVTNFDGCVRSYGERDSSGTRVCVDCGFKISYVYDMLFDSKNEYRYIIEWGAGGTEAMLFFNEEFTEEPKGEIDLLTNIQKMLGIDESITKDSFVKELKNFRKNKSKVYYETSYDIIHLIDKQGKVPIVGWNSVSTKDIRKNIDKFLSKLHPKISIKYDLFWSLANRGYYSSTMDGEKKSTSGKHMISEVKKALLSHVLFNTKFEKTLLNSLTKNLLHEIIGGRGDLSFEQISLLNIMKGDSMEVNNNYYNLGKVFAMYGFIQYKALSGKANHGIGDELTYAMKNPYNTVLLYEKVHPLMRKLDKSGGSFIVSKMETTLSKVSIAELDTKFSPEQKAYFLSGYVDAKTEHFDAIRKYKENKEEE